MTTENTEEKNKNDYILKMKIKLAEESIRSLSRELMNTRTQRDDAYMQLRAADEGLRRSPTIWIRAENAEKKLQEIQHKFDGMVAANDKLELELEELQQENKRLHIRLEDSHAWDKNGNRIDVEPGSIPDGIDCRDETIRLLKGEINRLRKVESFRENFAYHLRKSTEEFYARTKRLPDKADFIEFIWGENESGKQD